MNAKTQSVKLFYVFCVQSMRFSCIFCVQVIMSLVSTSNSIRESLTKNELEIQEVAKISAAFNYPKLVVVKMSTLLKTQLIQLLQATESPRHLTIFTNTLKVCWVSHHSQSRGLEFESWAARDFMGKYLYSSLTLLT